MTGHDLPAELSADQCARVLRALADPTRLEILSLLKEGPLTVSEVMQRLGIRQYSASRHLAALTELGLLDRERRRRHVFYSLRPGVGGEGRGATVELGCCRISVD